MCTHPISATALICTHLHHKPSLGGRWLFVALALFNHGDGPGGVTATVLLAESHLCIHTWPEQMGVTVDVYVCNFGADHSAKAQALMDHLIALFEPAQLDTHCLHRGRPLTGAEP